MVAPIADDDQTIVLDFGDALQKETRALAGIAHEDDVTGPRRPARRDHEEPVPLPQRRLHAVAADGHAPRPGYFLLA
jgi:hypothetical protein